MSTQQSFNIKVDIDPFQICPFCLRVAPIIILEIYMLIMFVKELIKSHRIYYDQLDKIIFFFSALSISADLVSIVFLNMALSTISYGLKVIGTFPLLLVFFRFVFDQFQCSKWFLILVLTFIFVQFLSIFFLGIIQIRYALLILYFIIGVCSLHQIALIRQFLKNQKSRKRQLKRNHKISQIQIQLLDRKQYQYKVLSNQFKYHIYLRKSFCITITCSLIITYIFMLNLEESRNFFGQFLVVSIVQMLTPGTYFFFSSANQWIIRRMNSPQNERQHSSVTISIQQR